MIRQQRYLLCAMDGVNRVMASDDRKRREQYLRLCHDFPVMVLTDGLCQSLAFIAAKRGPDENVTGDKAAYDDVQCNVRAVLEFPDGADILSIVRGASVPEYTRQTRAVLEAWVYFKRFAEARSDRPESEESA